jgi:hypothetical protein
LGGIAVYCMGSPFRKVPRVEYVYSGVAVQALDPIAPLVEGEVYDNKGVVFVPDIYSVWPEVGLFPKVSSYDELLEGFEEFLARKCSIRLSPAMCKRVSFKVIPWSGVMGAWRFTGLLGDAMLFMAYSMIELADQFAPISTVYVVVGEDTHPALAIGLSWASMAVAALTSANYKLLYAEPRPFPVEKGAESILYDMLELDYLEAARKLAHETSTRSQSAFKLLKPRTPKAARFVGEAILPKDQLEAVKMTVATLAFYERGMITPLIYQACGAKNPFSKLKTILTHAINVYIKATELHKKIVGGTLMHHLTVDINALLSLLAGSSLEAAILQILKDEGLGCEEVYENGIPVETLRKLTSKLSIVSDSTPSNCIEALGNRVRLAKGCLSKLRRNIL